MIVRSPFEEMKASPWEKEDAIHEGIPILDCLVPKAFLHTNGKLTGMSFDKVRAVRDDKGRRQLVSTGEPEQVFECDDVLVAVGQENAFPWIERDARPRLRRVGHAGARRGDAAVEPAARVLRRRCGARARRTSSGPSPRATPRRSRSTSSCNGEDVAARPAPGVTLVSQKMGIHEWSYDNDITTDLRHKVPWRDVNQSLRNIKVEVELGFDVATAWKEAQRCLNCDVQTVFNDGAVHRVRRLRRHLPDRLHHASPPTATRPSCAPGCTRRRATSIRRCTSRAR